MKSSMLLIIVLRLFTPLALVSGDCDCENSKLNDFDWDKLGIIVLILFHIKAAAKT
jgi:hypothetical protein